LACVFRSVTRRSQAKADTWHLAIEYRGAAQQIDQLTALAADLARRRVT